MGRKLGLAGRGSKSSAKYSPIMIHNSVPIKQEVFAQAMHPHPTRTMSTRTNFDESKVKRHRAGTSAGGRFDHKDQPADDSVELTFGEEPVNEPEPQTRYSFLEDWQQKVEEFDETYRDVPTRFFSADLMGSKDFVEPQLIAKSELAFQLAMEDGAYDDENYLPSKKLQGQLARNGIARAGEPAYVVHRLTQGTSSPKDARTASEDVEATAKHLGLTDLEPMDDPKYLRSFKSERMWSARNKVGGQVIITDGAAGQRNFAALGFKGVAPKGFDSGFQRVDVRTLIGSARLEKMTGMNPFEATLTPPPVRHMVKEGDGWVRVPEDEVDRQQGVAAAAQLTRVMKSATLLEATKKAQRAGNNFRSQQAYVREATSKKSAAAWEDKLYPDKVHQEMAANTRLNQSFAKVEIDNDVAPEEFADFEEAWMKAQEKLPKIPADRQPTLRIRKLGRHRANGMFVPHVNTVCIDVRTSEAAIHEMGHYFDITVEDNASLQGDFNEIVDQYSQKLTMPPGSESSASKYFSPSYYNTPTEVFARGFEMYASERLGVTGRVLKEDKFDTFPFAPFKNDPELKERLFKFFDDRGYGRSE